MPGSLAAGIGSIPVQTSVSDLNPLVSVIFWLSRQNCAKKNVNNEEISDFREPSGILQEG